MASLNCTARLASYTSMPAVSPFYGVVPANAGFVYDKDNKVKCIECDVKNVQMKNDMSIVLEHSTDCKFFRNYMSQPKNRLATFDNNWPKPTNITVEDLVDNGFYYKGPWTDNWGHIKYDVVQCVECNLMLHDWRPEDTVIGEHRKHNIDRNISCLFTSIV